MSTKEQLDTTGGYWTLSGGYGGADHYIRCGQRFLSITDQTITKMSFKIGNFLDYDTIGLPYYYQIIKYSDKSIIYSQLAGYVRDLVDIPAWVEITLTTPQYINEAVILCVYYHGDLTRIGVNVYYSTGDVVADEWGAYEHTANGWFSTWDWDCGYIYTYVGGAISFIPGIMIF